MVHLGGGEENGASPSNSFGASYDPTTNAWALTSTIDAPMGRLLHTAIWTGSEMIVWGGSNALVTTLGDGARYSLGTDSWTPVNPVGAPSPRYGHVSIWTGSEMIVWGGHNQNDALGDGAAYDPKTDKWRPISNDGAPSARYKHTAIWTGTEMIVWGGASTNPGTLLGDGARYDSKTDTWSSLATSGTPSPRMQHTAITTGSKMVVWGGRALSDSGDWLRTNTGGIYDLTSNTWTATSTCDAPRKTEGHAAVWTGSEMLVWGGAGCAHGHRFVP